MSVPTIEWMVPFVRVSADYWVDGTLRQGQCRLLGGWYHSSGSVLTIGWMVPFVRVSADYWVDGTLRQGQ